MAVSTMWIRDNMLCTSGQYERQLTEAELKVQRSLQKLSIPDWYLNKRSNPPKILSNVTPIESRPPSWKNVGIKKKPATNSSTVTLSVTYTLPRSEEPKSKMSDTGTYKITRYPKSPELLRRKSPPKSPSKSPSKSISKSPSKSPTKSITKSPSKSPSKSSSRNEPFDTIIPNVKISRNISNTFPKVSPSRKIQNINIVFPPGPKIDISDLEDDPITTESKYSTFVLKKLPEDEKQIKETRVSHLDSHRNYATWTTTPTKCRNDDQLSEEHDVSFGTPDVKSNFKVRAVSTPKCAPARLFSSTIIGDTSKSEMCESFLDQSSVIEKKLSQSVLESPVTTTPKPRNLSQSFLERNIRSIDPIIFEKDYSPRPVSSVREIVKKLDSKNHAEKKNPEMKPEVRSRNHAFIVLEKQSTPKSKKQEVIQPRSHPDTQSPCTRFLYAKKKSTELENIVKSTKPARRGVVQGIIDELNEKCKYSSKQTRTVPNQKYVKKLVNAMEKGDISQLDEVLHRKSDEDDTGSETETKSTTSISLKDTDSGDSDRSPVGNEKFSFEESIVESVKLSQTDEEDSVYWIPVSRCKLPRTSSLLSMMSRLSTHGQSPCVSPIRSDSEESQGGWGATFRTSLAKKLFRIDETAVADSGYSDRSDRSGSTCGSIDGTWCTQNDSGSESRFETMKRRRRTSLISRSTLV